MTGKQTPARAKWRQADVTKACKGVLGSGLDPQEVRIDPFSGQIIFFLGKSSAAASAATPLEDWLKTRETR